MGKADCQSGQHLKIGVEIDQSVIASIKTTTININRQQLLYEKQSRTQ